MKIEVWTDIACPFCYIGKQRLDRVLDGFEHKDEVEIIYRAFPLDPTAPKETDITIYGYIAKKYGMSVEQVKAWCGNLTIQSVEDGIQFDFDNLVATNSVDALRLMLFAQEKGKGSEVLASLYKALFEGGVSLSHHKELEKIAMQNSLDEEMVKDLLNSDKLSDKLMQDYHDAVHIGVRGVPYYRINNQVEFSGAQPVETFAQIIEETWVNQNVKSQAGNTCEDDNCYL